MSNDYQRWLKWLTSIQAIAQNGLTYAQNPFDYERFENLMSIAQEIAAHYTDLNFEKVKTIFHTEIGYYATPKLVVRAAVFQNNKILLVQEKEDQLWSLPGGWADVNESPSECVVKEVFQESGYKVKVIKLLGLYDRNKYHATPLWPHVYECCMLCEIIGGTGHPGVETINLDFFSENNLPSLSSERVTQDRIKRCFEYHFNPQLQADFD